MTGSRKKLIIAVVVIAAVVAAGIIGFFQLRNMALTGASDVPDTVVLRKTDLESKVTASGNFASLDPVSVGSNMLGGEVEQVFVDEGDKVYAGDVLARLKTSDIERSISDAKSAVSDLSRNDRLQLEAAQRAVNDAQAQYDSDNKWTQRDINNAKQALADAEDELANYVPPSPPTPTDPDLTTALEQAVTAAQNALDQAKRVRENTMRTGASRLTEAQAQLNALSGVDSARQSRSQLDSLTEELANASIVSPITGIVTRVLTEAGQTAMGSMFMIEDSERLKITASVAEFDIIKIEEGMIAHVTSNATGSKIYDGFVDFVAPVASDLSGNFEVSILLTSGVGQLKPGMTATVEIVIAAKRDIFAVPIDAVVTKPDGTTVVYAYEPGAAMMFSGAPVKTEGADGGPVRVDGADGGQVIGGGPVTVGPGGSSSSGGSDPLSGAGNQREIVVKTGMETDFYIEIISDELHEGMLIVSDPMGRNVRFQGSGPMMIGGPGGGQVAGAAPARAEGTVTYVAVD